MSTIKTFNLSAPTAVNSKAMELDGKSWNFFPGLCVKPILFVSFMLIKPFFKSEFQHACTKNSVIPSHICA